MVTVSELGMNKSFNNLYWIIRRISRKIVGALNLFTVAFSFYLAEILTPILFQNSRALH